MENKTLNDMISELEEYYECAGFADFYERVLKDMTEEEICKFYEKTFQEPDFELERWEQARAEKLL